MKVLLRTDKTVSVNDIPPGQCFVYEDIVYLKIKADPKYFPNNSFNLNLYVNCVEIVSGKLRHFGSVYHVFPCNIEAREIAPDTSWDDYDD